MLDVGGLFGLVPGIFYDRFGPTWTSACGLVIYVTAFILLWSTTKTVHLYFNRSWLMSVYFFFAGEMINLKHLFKSIVLCK